MGIFDEALNIIRDHKNRRSAGRTVANLLETIKNGMDKRKVLKAIEGLIKRSKLEELAGNPVGYKINFGKEESLSIWTSGVYIAPKDEKEPAINIKWIYNGSEAWAFANKKMVKKISAKYKREKKALLSKLRTGGRG
ncbi:MAG: hypothetical protein FWD15_03085 [Alphaproteobacteria bacterium]|nr:hypothetical protein [Alphaproteobacteria bacterium]